MMEWWEALTFLQKIFVGCAAPSSVFIILTFVLSCITLDAEFHHGNFDLDLDDPLGIFNLRGLMSFFAVGGLTGYGLTLSNFSDPIAITGGVASGLIMAKLVTSLMNYLMKTNYNGNIKTENTIGKIGEVYLTIPANGKDQGKVNVLVQGKLVEFNAITTKGVELKTGDKIAVIDVKKDNVLVVESATNYLKEPDILQESDINYLKATPEVLEESDVNSLTESKVLEEKQ